MERLAASIYKQGEQKSKAGDSAAAVDDFLRVASLAPTSKVRANADFDAAALLIKEKQWDRAIPVLEGFRRNFPAKPAAGGCHEESGSGLFGIESPRPSGRRIRTNRGVAAGIG